MNFRSIPKSQLALLGALIIIVLIPLTTWSQFNACKEEGILHMLFTSVENGRASGQIVGEGARWHRAQGDKVVLYSKTDIWYREPSEGAEIQLGHDCSWSVEGVHDGHRYVAFLVNKEYQPPGTIPVTTAASRPPLPIDGKHIIAWMFWSPDNSTPILTSGPQELAVNWLIEQIAPNVIVPNPLPNRAGLIISYQIPETDEAHPALFSRSWIYDNALAVIGFAANGNFAEALTILNALATQIKQDGRIGFSYKTEDNWYHENYQSGAIAWVGYAFVFYQQRTGDAQSQVAAERIARYLLSLQDTDSINPSYGSIRRGPNEPWYSTTDNIIGYFFLQDLGRLTGDAGYTEAAELIKASLLDHHWNDKLGRFDQGIGDPANGLVEANSLGALFLISVGETAKAQSGLDFVERRYRAVSAEGLVTGYAPYEDRSTVWSQGSLQMALAYKRSGDVVKSNTITEEIIKLQDTKGGVPYAMPKATVITEEVFQEWPSVAGTAWLAIILSDDGRFLGP
jgi:hypothetical protein